MKINLFKFERLEKQRQVLKEKLGVAADVGVDLAFDGVHALNDLCRSIANLHPHKRSIAVVAGQPPPLQKLISGFAGEGYSVQVLPASFNEDGQAALSEAWEKLKKDTLFVLSSVTEPLTGALYPTEWVRGEAGKKNIFSILYFSPDALKRGLQVPANPWEAFVLDPLWDGDYTTALCLKGDRAKGDPVLWGEPHFSGQAMALLEKALPKGSSGVQAGLEDEKAVRDFEKKAVERLKGGVRLLHESCPRLFDRAVLFVEGVNGEALQKELEAQGVETHTGASCAWDDPHTNNWLPQLGITEEMVQSSILVPLSSLKNSQAAERLVSKAAELRGVSGFKNS
jgi:hypothetical protein